MEHAVHEAEKFGRESSGDEACLRSLHDLVKVYNTPKYHRFVWLNGTGQELQRVTYLHDLHLD